MNPLATRRDILKGMTLGAGATLLAPILDQIAAHASGNDRAANRKRVIFVVQSNGMSPAHLRPDGVTGPRGDRPTNDRLNEIALRDRTLHAALEPLAPFKNKMTLVQGLSNRIARSDHSCNFGALGAHPANNGALAQTIDHAVADALPAIFPHVGIGLGGTPTTTMNFRLSAFGRGRACPIVCSPELAYRSLFGSVAEGNARAEFNQRSNLLDFMADDVRRSRDVLVGDDRERFDQYMNAFETLHTRQVRIADMRDAIRTHAPQLGDRMRATVSSLILEAQFEIGAAAVIAGLTNTLLLTSGGGGQAFGTFPEMGIAGLHGIGHGGRSTDGTKSSEESFVELRRFHTRLIANLARRLDGIREGNGTVLDNTVIVYLSDSGEQHHPLLYEFPIVMIGNLGGRLRTAGRYLEFPGYGQRNHRTLANFYCTLLHAVGAPRDRFGVEDNAIRDIDQTGTVPELLA